MNVFGMIRSCWFARKVSNDRRELAACQGRLDEWMEDFENMADENSGIPRGALGGRPLETTASGISMMIRNRKERKP